MDTELGPVPASFVQVRFSGCSFTLCCRQCWKNMWKDERTGRYCAALDLIQEESSGFGSFYVATVNMPPNGVLLLHHLRIPKPVLLSIFTSFAFQHTLMNCVLLPCNSSSVAVGHMILNKGPPPMRYCRGSQRFYSK